MNNTFYNNKITLIVPSKIGIELPTYVDLYVGKIEECYVKIKKYELDNDEFYNGHLILTNTSLIRQINFEQLLKINNNSNILFTRNINHSGVAIKCTLDETLMFCNSFVFSIVANSNRTENNVYGDCISHRIQLKTFKNENSSLYKRSIT